MSTDVFVKSYTHLKDRPKADQALLMLQRIASLVKPIMRKRNWILPTLSEFFPDNDSLIGLNVNGGQQILLRLRPAWAPDTFYEEGSVIKTMLHELTHNVHGPHDEKFYKYLSGLEDEFDALQRSGYAGEGFFSDGKRLGANISHNVPLHLARAKALEAAEKRRKSSILTSGSGAKLGGINVRGLSPRELAVKAAERRLRDQKACGQGEMAEREAEKAFNESTIDVIDLTSDNDSDGAAEITSGPSNIATSLPKHKKPWKEESLPEPTDRKRQKASTNPRRITSNPPSQLEADRWACVACTLINEALALQCVACLSLKPSSLGGWTCLACGESGMEHEFWSCRVCGVIKSHS